MNARLLSAADYETYRAALVAARDPETRIVSFCGGAGCRGCGAGAVADSFRAELARQGVADRVRFRVTGCQGFCEQAPLLVVQPEGTVYCHVTMKDVADIVSETIVGRRVIDRLLVRDAEGRPCRTEQDIPFYHHQLRLLLAANARLDPLSIDDYISVGGYGALVKVLTSMKPEQVVAEVTRSGLRGRGGGGFPAGSKWESCRRAPAADGVRYIICNADEGDPGAFMDCALMEGNPHSVIEGMIIGAWAIGMPGAPKGYVYIRNEYPVAREHLAVALEQARALGLLGPNILGSGLDFDVSVSRGGGAFVCGESTALMASIEGRVGEPRAKHIHTVVSGLWNRPTNLNNVESWANVPLIVNRGAAWYADIGTGDVSADPWGGSTGTKIFSLVGKVKNTGLVEVPMGAPLRHIIFDIGGGMRDGKEFKAVQTGGPSGGCLPARLLDLPVDFDRLTAAGSMMGSGGMIVMDDSTCMVDVARYFLHFLSDESCGKCTTCREGLRQLCAIVDRLCAGEGCDADLALLDELGETVNAASLCGLGQSAASPLRSTLKYFQEEYLEHVKGKCRAHVCKGLITFSIDAEKCDGCRACVRPCPTGAIAGSKGTAHVINDAACIKCGVCRDSCTREAVLVA
jgi:NADH:ubiquinone oxidoreductase subunit F (NADH-binding)/(2Fe-2S) ferredoxin